MVEVLKLEDPCDVGNVSVEPYVRAREMQTLATAGAGRGVDPMAHRPQSAGDVLPYPATVPGTVHQYEGVGLRSVRRALVPGCGVLREAQCRQAGAAPTQYVSSSHRHGALKCPWPTWSVYRPCPRP